MIQVGLLAFPPCGLGLAQAVAAGFDDRRDFVAELGSDALQGLAPALVLGGVMKEGGDRLVLGGPGLDDDRCHTKQVPEVRDAGALSLLPGVKLVGQLESPGEARAERWSRFAAHGPMLFRR